MTYNEYLRAKNHVYLGLLGGGPRLVRRRMQVLDALPCNEFLRTHSYAIAHPHTENCRVSKNGYELTAAACFKRGDDIRYLVSAELMQSSVEDFDQEMQRRTLEILEDQKKKDEGQSNNIRSSTVVWSSFEFVKAGTDFDFTIKLNDVTDAQIGLFLHSLNRFAHKHFGGQSRNGLGRFALNDVMLVGDGVEIENIFNNNELVTTNEGIAPFMAAWDDAVATVSAAELEELLRGESKEEKVAKQAEKDAKAAASKAQKLAAKAALVLAKA